MHEVTVICLLVFLYSTCQIAFSVPIVVSELNGEKFSAAPNNTPITKVYIFGRPVYIREPFVIPQRDEQIDFPKLIEDASRQRKHRAPYVDEPVLAAKPKYAEHKYPLKQCYTETSGFMCCNPKLEKVMSETALKMKSSKSCNLQKMSSMLQAASEKAFGTDFEAIAGTGDFASKIHFYSDFVCKMEREGRTMLVYATPSRHNYAMPYQL
ncbi:Ground-like domain-containing protein [Caenorhabditis elegans]|uniref:Ground-like domain-containing protein n=1 Tax=Caenorhabditis elegans TaxID=6239 RepID=Q7YXB4_CAEEL|nr:Ground-like domain-containing protein [Caenorhabditis elegans]CAD92406.1 Ground-like domain-containing protein [Caenorhabditis elegans]|eukprot:NP_001021831.1 GRounDhog (hedgehog-like family) [Caenorhabditis elegans]